MLATLRVAFYQREAELNAVSSTWFEPFAALLEVHFTIMLQQYQLSAVNIA
jgi:hypothetical protein